MRDLSKAKIYKSINTQNVKIDIGSTTKDIQVRLQQHKGETGTTRKTMPIIQAMKEIRKDRFFIE